MLHMNTAVNTLQMPLVVFSRLLEKSITLACMYINMSVYAENNVDITTTRGITILRPFGHSDNEMFSPIINF